MEEVKLGGKNTLCFSGSRDEDNTTDARYRLQQVINTLNAKREDIKKDKSQKTKLSVINEEIRIASKRLDAMSLIPICQGGAWCKFGAHVSNVQPNGTLFVIDTDNFNGRPDSNVPDIVEKRAALKKTINSLNIERTYKISLLEENTPGINRHEVQTRVSDIGTQLADLRGEYMNMFNRILLFPAGSTPLVIKSFVPEVKVSTEAIMVDMASFCGLPPSVGVDSAVRDWYMQVYTFRTKMLSKKKKAANAMMINAIHNFLSLREKKFRAIANASAEDASDLYRNLIQSKYFISITCLSRKSWLSKRNNFNVSVRRCCCATAY
jgi:hypothetical protein